MIQSISKFNITIAGKNVLTIFVATETEKCLKYICIIELRGIPTKMLTILTFFVRNTDEKWYTCEKLFYFPAIFNIFVVSQAFVIWLDEIFSKT